MGQDGFTWFIGVVEDRADPKKAGRVRVRCLGYHSAKTEDIPTEGTNAKRGSSKLLFSWLIS